MDRLSELLESNRFEELETDTLELKPLPSKGGEWTNIYQSACALLNTRGGIILIGVKEEGTGLSRTYRLTGFRSEGEQKLNQLWQQFRDEAGRPLDIEDRFPPPQLFDFRGEQLCAVFVDELPADIKFAFFNGN